MGPRGASLGFTLLELLVALTLMSLLALGAFTALNLSVKTIQRTQAASDKLQEFRVGANILERSLSSAVRGTLDQKVYFEGNIQEMKFFTLLPLEAYNLGGVYHWRVLLGQDEAGKGVVAVEQARNVNWRRDPEGVEIRQIIIRDVASLQLAYGRGESESQTWVGSQEGKLPEWVRVRLTLAGQTPLEWLIPVYAARYGKQ